MKFLSSSSSSASSTITTSTTTAAATPSDGNNVNSSKSATAGCIAGVFRRLLCLNSLPTYPSDDHFRETELENSYSSSVEFDIKAEVKVEGPASTPNIVARLMGLESLPQIDLLNKQKGSSCSAISRSRSMNSVDAVLKELEYSGQGKHRRVKSFRETPTFLDLEDENFLILSFENGAERIKLAPKGKKSAAEKAKTKNKRREQSSVGLGKNKENQDTRNGSDEELEVLMTQYRTKSSGTHVSHDDAMLKDSSNNILRSNKSSRNSLATSDQAKFSKPAIHRHERDKSSRRRRRITKIEDECLPVKKPETESADDSENSSPNSVLDNTIDFPCDPEDTIISGGVSMLRNSKTRRTLTEELENYRKLNLGNGQNIALKSKTVAGKRFQLRRSTGNDQRYPEMSRMAEKETMESSWVRSSKIQKLEDYDDEEIIIIISTELELKILDELVTELVVDLLLHPRKFS